MVALIAVLVNASHLALVVGAIWFVAGVVLVGLRGPADGSAVSGTASPRG